MGLGAVEKFTALIIWLDLSLWTVLFWVVDWVVDSCMFIYMYI